MIVKIQSETAMRAFGAQIGACVRGGECIELVGDVGAGKTTFVKGLAEGLQVSEPLQSPSFTISRVYEARDDLRLYHYDFYRLNDPGIMEYEFAESLGDDHAITVVEWADEVADVLPAQRLTIRLTATSESAREVHIEASDMYAYCIEHIAEEYA